MARSADGLDPIDLMVQAAELYYELGLTQEQIAAHLNVSRPTVSRLLSQARAEEIVRISVVNPKSRANELEKRLVQQWGLHDAVVVPTTVMRGDLLLQKLGEAGARYLERNLPNGVHLGIGLGRTVYQLVHSLDGVAPRPRIVPLCGGTVFSESAYHVNEIARIAAQRLHGYCHYLHAPVQASSEQAYRTFLAEASVAEVIAMWDRLDWALVGIGSANNLETAEFQAFVQKVTAEGAKPVADICQTLIDAEGKPCASTDETYVIAIDLAQLRNAERVIAVAGGVHKADAVRAALLTGVIDVLLTDESTALHILQSGDAAGGADAHPGNEHPG